MFSHPGAVEGGPICRGFLPPVRSQDCAAKVAEEPCLWGSAECCVCTLTLHPGRRRGQKEIQVLTFFFRGSGPDLPLSLIRQSNLVPKAKPASLFCMVYQSAVVCTLSPGYL